MADFVIPLHVVAAAGVIRNAKGEILLTKNPRRGWEYPGGMIESGEDLISGLKREIYEETSARVQVGELFCVSSNTCFVPGYNGVEKVPPKVVFDFICSYEGGAEDFTPNDESLETIFVPQEKVLDMVTAPVYRERFSAYLGYSGRPVYIQYETYPEYRKLYQRSV